EETPSTSDKVENAPANDNSLDLMPSLKRDPREVLNEREETKKYHQVRLALNEIKRQCDLIDLKYRSSNGVGGIFGFLRDKHNSTMSDLKDVIDELNKVSKR